MFSQKVFLYDEMSSFSSFVVRANFNIALIEVGHHVIWLLESFVGALTHSLSLAKVVVAVATTVQFQSEVTL